MHSASTLTALQAKLDRRELSCVQVVQRYLHTIREKNGHYNAFLEVFEDEALREARRIDDRIVQKKAGKLAGLVLGIKDNICYKGHTASASSKMLENFISPYSATVVDRLLNEDAIIIGRLNCDEFAMGATNQTSAFGNVPNPYSPDHVAGGSSGGNAVAITTQMCMASLGSDTGGSVRQPASFCNILGYKPTYGSFSRYGLIAFASSFDQIGVLSNSVDDIVKISEIIAGSDPLDATTVQRPFAQSIKKYKLPSSLRIAVLDLPKTDTSYNPEIENRLESLIQHLEQDKHKVDRISFPYVEYLTPCYHILSTAEASSNLARFDGIRFGYRSKQASSVDDVYINSRSEGFGNEVKRRIMFGNFVLKNSYTKRHYTNAQKVRKLLSDHYDQLFSQYDFILSPTTTSTAYVMEKSQTFNSTHLKKSDLYTVTANLIGAPAMSIPCGFSSEYLPIGIHLMSKPFSDELLFHGSKILQNATKDC